MDCLTILDSDGNIVYTSNRSRTDQNALHFMPFMATQNVCAHILDNSFISFLSTASNIILCRRLPSSAILLVEMAKSLPGSPGGNRQRLYASKMLNYMEKYLALRLGPDFADILTSYSRRQQVNFIAICQPIVDRLFSLFASSKTDSSLLVEGAEYLQISPDLRKYCVDSLIAARDHAFSQTLSASLNTVSALDPETECLLIAGSKLVAATFKLRNHSISSILPLLVLYASTLSALETLFDVHVGQSAKTVWITRLPMTEFIGGVIVVVFETKIVNMSDYTQKCRNLFEFLIDSGGKGTPSINQGVLDFLAIRADSHVSMLNFLSLYPGIVQFVYKDRTRGISISPCSEGLWRFPSSKANDADMKQQSEQVETNRLRLRTEMETLIWESQNKKRLVYTTNDYKLIYRKFDHASVWSVWLNVVPDGFAESLISKIVRRLQHE